MVAAWTEHDAAWVVLVLLVCWAAFPTALWLGMRRSRYAITLDFDSGSIQVDETRSFDPPLHYEAPLDAVEGRAEGSVLHVAWREEPSTVILVPLGDEKEAARIADRMRAVQRNR